MDKLSQFNQTKKQRFSSKSIKFNAEFEQIKEVVPGFEEASILAHYHTLQKQHYEHLSTINMSDVLKRKLFGFSPISYLTNQQTPDDLILENHPLKGRIIMTKARYEQRQSHSQRKSNPNDKPWSDSSSVKQHNISLKMNETNNKNQVSGQLLLDEGNETNGRVQITEGRLLADTRI